MRGEIVRHSVIRRDSAHGPGKGVPELAVRGLIEIEMQPVVGQQTDVAAGRQRKRAFQHVAGDGGDRHRDRHPVVVALGRQAGNLES